MVTFMFTPLTVTLLSVQARVRVSLTPETMTLVPAGGVEGAPAGDWVPVPGIPGIAGMLGMLKLGMTGVRPGLVKLGEGAAVGEATPDPLSENWCAMSAATTPTIASTRTTNTQARIRNRRDDRGLVDGGNGPLPPV